MKSFDAFARPVQEFQVKTTCGGYLSVCAICLVATLFVQELRYFLELESRDEMVVDHNQDQKYLNISVDITFPDMPCAVLGINLIDPKKANIMHVSHEIYKTRLSPQGQVLGVKVRDSLLNVAQTPSDVVDSRFSTSVRTTHATTHLRCPSCFQSHIDEDDCCASCEDVRKEFRSRGWADRPSDYVFGQCVEDVYAKTPPLEHEGCRLQAQLHVRKVPATLHLGISRSFKSEHLAAKSPLENYIQAMDFSHTIEKLAFGPDFPGNIYVLDGRQKGNHTPGTSDYFLYDVHVIPTRYEEDGLPGISSHQYSVIEHRRTVDARLAHEASSNLGLWVNYDFTPFEVKVTKTRKSLWHFLTECCAILGGIFAFTGMLDKFAYLLNTSVTGARTKRTELYSMDNRD